jgi:diacylglycerol kinase (ATP)
VAARCRKPAQVRSRSSGWIVTLPHTAKWRVLGVALRAATRGLGPQPTAERYAFTTLKPIPLQLDGELLTLDAATPVRIDIAPRALATVG